MRNRFFSLVAHIREAKSLAADLAVAGIDHQMMFFPQLSRQVQNVDAFIVFHAGERLRAKAFLSEEIESSAAHPIVDERVGPRVPSVTRLEAFLEDFVELRLRARGYVRCSACSASSIRPAAFELEEIEVETAIRDFVGACEGLFPKRRRAKSQAAARALFACR